MSQLLTPDLAETRREQLIAIAAGQTRFEANIMARILTGTKIYARLIWSVAPGHEHSYKRVLVSLIDISQRRQIEEAYRLLVEHSPQGLAILDATGVVFANPALSSIVGYPPWRLPPLLPLRPAGLRCPS